MIHFITNEPQHLKLYRSKLYDNIIVREDNDETYETFKLWIINHEVIGYDVESNGLDAWTNKTILKIIGTEQDQFIFHTPYCNINRYLNIIKLNNSILLGHNIKFDLKFLITEDNFYYNNVWDTMLAEQRIYMKSGLPVSLDNLAIRYLDKYPDAMDKRIRKDFIGVDVERFKVKPKHLYYGASDVSNLFPIKEKQEINIQKYNLEFLVYNIEFPLIPIVAKAEITGFLFDTEKWLEIYEENAKKRFKVECKLDEEVRRLRDITFGVNNEISGLLYTPEKRLYMVGGKWDKERTHNPAYDLFNDDGTTNVLDLFGEPMSKKTYTGLKKKVKKNPNNINYGSPVEIMEIFGRLEEPLLNQNEQLVIPTFTKTHKIDKTYHSFKTGEEAFHMYLSMVPKSKMRTFVELLLEFRGLNTACNNFGSNFINKINPITGNLHTVFRQCFAETGRFQSGGGRKEPDKPNFQNIPSKAKYAVKMRNCFKAREGYSIGTHDLSGAELIIMCSLSQDMKLLSIAKEDMHSYIAQGSWRAIYKKRALDLIKQYDTEKSLAKGEYTNPKLAERIRKNIDLAKNFVVNNIDKVKKKIRTAFKPLGFGTIYGLYATKAAKSINTEMSKVGMPVNVTKEEGQIVINFIQGEFPDVFKMVIAASQFARANGYLILNKRTNSRAWFPTIIKVLRGIQSEKFLFKQLSDEMSQARNIKIQGTQADMIKECSVEIQKWIDNNDYTDEIILLSWVHDEIVDEHPKYLDGKSEVWEHWAITQPPLQYNDNEYISFPELKAQIMRDTCNKYLENVTMDVGYDVEPYWTK